MHLHFDFQMGGLCWDQFAVNRQRSQPFWLVHYLTRQGDRVHVASQFFLPHRSPILDGLMHYALLRKYQGAGGGVIEY